MVDKMTRQQLLQRGSILVGGLALGGFVAGCGNDEEPDESASQQPAMQDVSLVEGAHVIGFAPVYVALHGGLFEENGLNVKYSTSSTGTSSALGAVTGGSSLIAITGAPASLAAKSEGAPVRIVGVISDQYGAEITASNELLDGAGVSPESSLADKLEALNGAKIGIYNPGDSTDQLIQFLYTVAAPDIEPGEDVELISLKTSSNILAAFQRGDVDAICASSPVGPQAEASGYGKVFIRGAESPELDGYPYMALTASESAVNEDFETVKAGVKAIAQASKQLKEDPESAKQYVLQEFDTIKPEVFKLAYASMIEAIPDTPVLTEKQFAIAQNFAETLGAPLDVTYEEAIAPRVGEQAAAEL